VKAAGETLTRLAQLDGAAFRLAGLAAKRFPEGDALDAYLDATAALADYLRCEQRGCLWGRETIRHGYCRSHAAERTAASKRAHRASQGEPEPPSPDCCGDPPPWPGKVRGWQDDPGQADARGYEATAHQLARGHRADPRPLRMLGGPASPTRFTCGQHRDAGKIGRGYEAKWCSGARGASRVEWLCAMLGQPGHAWGVHDMDRPLDTSDDGRAGRLKGTATPYPDLRRRPEARDWFAGHAGWVNYPLPETAARPSRARWGTASELRPGLDRLAEIHRIRHVNGFWPWCWRIGENVRVWIEGAA
jgi:hypothetical protein